MLKYSLIFRDLVNVEHNIERFGLWITKTAEASSRRKKCAMFLMSKHSGMRLFLLKCRTIIGRLRAIFRGPMRCRHSHDVDISRRYSPSTDRILGREMGLILMLMKLRTCSRIPECIELFA